MLGTPRLSIVTPMDPPDRSCLSVVELVTSSPSLYHPSTAVAFGDGKTLHR
jgi:hypothetical protein